MNTALSVAGMSSLSSAPRSYTVPVLASVAALRHHLRCYAAGSCLSAVLSLCHAIRRSCRSHSRLHPETIIIFPQGVVSAGADGAFGAAGEVFQLEVGHDLQGHVRQPQRVQHGANAFHMLRACFSISWAIITRSIAHSAATARSTSSTVGMPSTSARSMRRGPSGTGKPRSQIVI